MYTPVQRKTLHPCNLPEIGWFPSRENQRVRSVVVIRQYHNYARFCAKVKGYVHINSFLMVRQLTA